jgi:hypothetical protein
MAAVVNPVRPQTPQIRGRRHRRGLLLVVPALLTASISGTLSAALPPLSVAEDGNNITPITGDLAQTLGPVTLAADGTYLAPIAGDLAHTLPPLTSALVGTVPITGALAASLPPLTSALDGTFVPAPIAGDLALTLGPVTLDSSSVSARNTLRLSPLQPRILGRRHRKGVLWLVAPRSREDSLVLALPPVVLAATGTVTTTPIFGQMDPRAPRGAFLHDRALAAAQRPRGRRIYLGFQYAPLAVVPTTDINLTAPSLVLSASGTVSPPVSGTLIQTLPSLVAAETSLVEITGTLAASLPPLTAAEVAFTDRLGALGFTLPPLTSALAGAVVATDGTLTLALPPLQASVAGTNPDVFGDLNLTFAQLAVTTFVPAPRFGVLTYDLPPITLSATGATLVASADGSLALLLPVLGMDGTIPAGAIGDLALVLPSLVLQLQQTDFATLRFTGVGDVAYLLVGVGDQALILTGDGTPIAYLLRGVDP